MSSRKSIALLFGIAFLTAFLSLVPSLAQHSFASRPVYAQAASMPKNFVGVWEGRGYQDDNRSEWSILISITPGPKDTIVGTVAYPSLTCGGELTLSDVKAEQIRLVEKLTYGNKRCVDRGSVELSNESPRRLNYKWFYSNGSFGAKGTLRRISSN